jgi:hypothetical protein
MVEDQPLSRPLAPRLILLVLDIPISTLQGADDKLGQTLRTHLKQ